MGWTRFTYSGHHYIYPIFLMYTSNKDSMQNRKLVWSTMDYFSSSNVTLEFLAELLIQEPELPRPHLRTVLPHFGTLTFPSRTFSSINTRGREQICNVEFTFRRTLCMSISCFIISYHQ